MEVVVIEDALRPVGAPATQAVGVPWPVAPGETLFTES
jgi:hypothetical protein